MSNVIVEFTNGARLLQQIRAVCKHPLYARWNVPIWVDVTEGEPLLVVVGIALTRQGACTEWSAPYPGEAVVNDIRRELAEIWAARINNGFLLHPPMPSDDDDETYMEWAELERKDKTDFE